MTAKLAPKHMDRWLEGVFDLSISGVPDAVFFKLVKYRVLCYIIAFSILALSVIAGLWRFFTKKDSKAAQFMLAMLVGNLVACSLVIGPISRYLLYFWGFVYISWILFIYELVSARTKKSD